jgi:hypothetical protein
MCNGENYAVEHTHRDIAEFAIVITIIQQGNSRTAKEGRKISEVNAMLGKVGSSFLLVPFKLHSTV